MNDDVVLKKGDIVGFNWSDEVYEYGVVTRKEKNGRLQVMWNGELDITSEDAVNPEDIEMISTIFRNLI